MKTRMLMKMRSVLIFLVLSFPCLAIAQQKPDKNNEIYVDAKGVIRLQDESAASYFGVNYTLPFAYGYRSHQTLNIDLEKAIDQDVYHLARLGINAFRVHVWDTEISDSLGNLQQNEHLRLFDYLVAKLEERKIRIIITPIAFWGNGYPDKDERTGSFSEKYGKDGAVVNEAAFLAQERYLGQFFRHVNPYTKKTYAQDVFVIATEINNEPHHSGEKSRTTSYINRMMKAIQLAGWTKPVFYNISESPAYADAVAKSNVNGFSFQWYPTGLVSGHELKGNFLVNVDRYVIPFDTIPAFKNKARMIYEFDAGDVLQPYMYPAMARSFKSAGFQWATQFAYDPMGTAFANTEYQTHYLNLAYTPTKAISLLIAARVFHQVPLYKSYGSYPADTVFDAFKVSYHRQSSEMNAAAEFYYANGTTSVPVKEVALQHIAGVGSSPIVQYSGKGAYFLDKIAGGCWRLEVMPDAIPVHDPFEKTALDREVTRIVYSRHDMKILLSDLGVDFKVTAVNTGNTSTVRVSGTTFSIEPGTYLVQRDGLQTTVPTTAKIGVIGLTEFVAPLPKKGTSAAATDRNTMELTQDSLKLALHDKNGLSLFDGKDDGNKAVFYSPDWKTDPYEFTTEEDKPVLKLIHHSTADTRPGGVEFFVKNKINASTGWNRAESRASKFSGIVIQAGATRTMSVKITLIDGNGFAYSAIIPVGKQIKVIHLPFSAFKQDSFILLPRPYPGFQTMDFSIGQKKAFQFDTIEKIQFMPQGNSKDEFSVTLANIRLETI